MRPRLIIVVTGLALASCMPTKAVNTFTDYAAHADLRGADGSPRGRVLIGEAGGPAFVVHVQAEGLPAGRHGIHIHTVGRCDAPDFQTAGGHWNPAGKQHGRDNPMGAHQGDLPNIEIRADGRGNADFTVAGGTLSELVDSDGAAIVIHASADDYRTDPSGNSGSRVACGVITRNP